MARTQTTVPAIAVLIDTPEFNAGFVEGITGAQNGFHTEQPPTEDGIVEIIRNLTEIAVEGWLKEGLLRHDVGLIAGWLSRPVQQ